MLPSKLVIKAAPKIRLPFHSDQTRLVLKEDFDPHTWRPEYYSATGPTSCTPNIHCRAPEPPAASHGITCLLILTFQNALTPSARQVLDIVRVENLKRQLCMFTAQGQMLREQNRVLDLMEAMAKGQIPQDQLDVLEAVYEHEEKRLMTMDAVIGRISINITRAVNLPMMDMFRGCDPYLVTYLDSSPKDEVYSTEPLRKQRNPTWDDARYSWDVKRTSKWLTVTVIDRDQLTKDDIVGCVTIDVESLPFDQKVQARYQVENPSRTQVLRDAKLDMIIYKASPGNEAGEQEVLERDEATNGHHHESSSSEVLESEEAPNGQTKTQDNGKTKTQDNGHAGPQVGNSHEESRVPEQPRAPPELDGGDNANENREKEEGEEPPPLPRSESAAGANLGHGVDPDALGVDDSFKSHQI